MNKLAQVETSFGRVLTDGNVAICDANHPDAEESPYFKSYVIPVAERLWTMPIQESIAWPDLTGLGIKPCCHTDGINCNECSGSGVSECRTCHQESDCDDCGGTGVHECDCLAGFFIPTRPRKSAISLGEFHEGDESVGANPLYLMAIQESIGPVTACWFGDVGVKTASNAFVFVGERGRAILMPYRMGPKFMEASND